MTSALRTRSRVLVADYPPGAVFGPRVLSDHELVWLLSGSAQWLVQRPDSTGMSTGSGHREVHDLRPGTVAVAQSGWRDELRWDPVRPSRHAYVHFAVTEPDLLPPPAQWPAVVSATTPLLRALTDELVADGDTPGARRRSDLVVELLVELVVAGSSMGHEVPTDPIDAAVVDHVASDWRTDGLRSIPVDELAAAAHVSPRQLFRTFAHRHGVGPARALELVRLSRAAMMLHRSNESVARIATRTGFANPYHFSRRFTAVHGQPPRRFRSDSTADPMGPVHAANLGWLAHRLLAEVPPDR